MGVESNKREGEQRKGVEQKGKEQEVKERQGVEREYVKQGKITSQFCWNGMVVTKEQLVHTLNHAHNKGNKQRQERLGSASGPGLDVNSPLLPTTYDLSSPCQLAAFVKEALDSGGHGSNSRDRGSSSREGYGNRRSDDVDGGSGSGSSSGSGSGSGSDNDVKESSFSTPPNNHDLALDPVLWIMKRYRGRQSMDYPITSYLPCALRYVIINNSIVQIRVLR